MVRAERVATQGLLTFISMPLLTELVSIKDGFSYKHGAPNGAFRQPPDYVQPPRGCYTTDPRASLLATSNS